MKTKTSANEQATPAAVSATKPAHTPTPARVWPYKFIKFNGDEVWVQNIDRDAPTIFPRHHFEKLVGDGKVDPAEIVRAVNSHAELVAALCNSAIAWEAMLEYSGDDVGMAHACRVALTKVRTALAKF